MADYMGRKDYRESHRDYRDQYGYQYYEDEAQSSEEEYVDDTAYSRSRLSEDSLARFLIRTLVRTNGKESLRKIVNKNYQPLELAGIQDTSELRNFLQYYSHCFKLKKIESESDGLETDFSSTSPNYGEWDSRKTDSTPSEELEVEVTTNLKVCERHSQASGSCDGNVGCGGLHVCKFFVLSGKCTFEQNCKFGHWHSKWGEHNQRVLKRHLMDHLDIHELRVLFRRRSARTPVTRPIICKFYNSVSGCNKGSNCNALHLCKSVLFDECAFGDRCRCNHSLLDPVVAHILSQYAIEVEDLAELMWDNRNSPAPARQVPKGPKSNSRCARPVRGRQTMNSTVNDSFYSADGTGEEHFLSRARTDEGFFSTDPAAYSAEDTEGNVEATYENSMSGKVGQISGTSDDSPRDSRCGVSRVDSILAKLQTNLEQLHSRGGASSQDSVTALASPLKKVVPSLLEQRRSLREESIPSQKQHKGEGASSKEPHRREKERTVRYQEEDKKVESQEDGEISQSEGEISDSDDEGRSKKREWMQDRSQAQSPRSLEKDRVKDAVILMVDKLRSESSKPNNTTSKTLLSEINSGKETHGENSKQPYHSFGPLRYETQRVESHTHAESSETPFTHAIVHQHDSLDGSYVNKRDHSRGRNQHEDTHNSYTDSKDFRRGNSQSHRGSLRIDQPRHKETQPWMNETHHREHKKDILGTRGLQQKPVSHNLLTGVSPDDFSKTLQCDRIDDTTSDEVNARQEDHRHESGNFTKHKDVEAHSRDSDSRARRLQFPSGNWKQCGRVFDNRHREDGESRQDSDAHFQDLSRDGAWNGTRFGGRSHTQQHDQSGERTKHRRDDSYESEYNNPHENKCKQGRSPNHRSRHEGYERRRDYYVGKDHGQDFRDRSSHSERSSTSRDGRSSQDADFSRRKRCLSETEDHRGRSSEHRSGTWNADEKYGFSDSPASKDRRREDRHTGRQSPYHYGRDGHSAGDGCTADRGQNSFHHKKKYQLDKYRHSTDFDQSEKQPERYDRDSEASNYSGREHGGYHKDYTGRKDWRLKNNPTEHSGYHKDYTGRKDWRLKNNPTEHSGYHKDYSGRKDRRQSPTGSHHSGRSLTHSADVTRPSFSAGMNNNRSASPSKGEWENWQAVEKYETYEECGRAQKNAHKRDWRLDARIESKGGQESIAKENRGDGVLQDNESVSKKPVKSLKKFANYEQWKRYQGGKHASSHDGLNPDFGNEDSEGSLHLRDLNECLQHKRYSDDENPRKEHKFDNERSPGHHIDERHSEHSLDRGSRRSASRHTDRSHPRKHSGDRSRTRDWAERNLDGGRGGDSSIEEIESLHNSVNNLLNQFQHSRPNSPTEMADDFDQDRDFEGYDQHSRQRKHFESNRGLKRYRRGKSCSPERNLGARKVSPYKKRGHFNKFSQDQNYSPDFSDGHEDHQNFGNNFSNESDDLTDILEVPADNRSQDYRKTFKDYKAYRGWTNSRGRRGRGRINPLSDRAHHNFRNIHMPNRESSGGLTSDTVEVFYDSTDSYGETYGDETDGNRKYTGDDETGADEFSNENEVYCEEHNDETDVLSENMPENSESKFKRHISRDDLRHRLNQREAGENDLRNMLRTRQKDKLKRKLSAEPVQVTINPTAAKKERRSKKSSKSSDREIAVTINSWDY